MRAFLAAAAIVLSLALLPAQVPPSAMQANAPVQGFEQTQNWLRIARTHTIGSFDEPAKTVAGWSSLALQRVLDDMQLIRLLLVNAMRQPAGAEHR